MSDGDALDKFFDRSKRFEEVAQRCHEEFTLHIELLCSAFLQKYGPKFRLESSGQGAETRAWIVRDETCNPANICDHCVPIEADDYYRRTDIPVEECVVVSGFETGPTFFVRYERRPAA